MFLLDVNALFATLAETHIKSDAVIRWLQTTDRYASCGITQLAHSVCCYKLHPCADSH